MINTIAGILLILAVGVCVVAFPCVLWMLFGNNGPRSRPTRHISGPRGKGPSFERQGTQGQIDTLNKTADEATSKLSETEKRIADLSEQLATASTQLKQLTTERDTAQSKMSEKQSEFEAMENELAKAKEATQQANAKATELENVANEAKDAETERSKLQAALDQANKEIERLKMSLSNRSKPHLSRASQSHRRQEKDGSSSQ